MDKFHCKETISYILLTWTKVKLYIVLNISPQKNECGLLRAVTKHQ